MVGDSATAFTGGYPVQDEPVQEGTSTEIFSRRRKDSGADATRVSGAKGSGLIA